jgi:hypothetical protein
MVALLSRSAITLYLVVSTRRGGPWRLPPAFRIYITHATSALMTFSEFGRSHLLVWPDEPSGSVSSGVQHVA